MPDVDVLSLPSQRSAEERAARYQEFWESTLEGPQGTPLHWARS